MVKKPYLVFLFCFVVGHVFAQTGTITGRLLDHTIGEPLIGATVLIGPGVGTITDFDGKFSISAEYGDYTLTISYVGYEPFSQPITLDRKLLVIKDMKLKTTTLNEVQVVADIARERETPVAFATILPAKIEEELAAQDIPMVLNSTPGVYATQRGGGDGDARVTIRGFDQTNIAVMIDGVPVNDMENGLVYWSNWFGLDAATRSIQVQRGLGASKIAIPSVGGTLNILTKGIDNKRNVYGKQEIGSFGLVRTSFGYNSGRGEKGWGMTIAASYKKRDGFAQHTFSRAWFYFVKVEKMVGDHIIGMSAFGAPQRHGQRSFSQSIGTFSRDFALKHMDGEYIDALALQDLGYDYNPHWGELDRYSLAANGDTIHGETEFVNTKLNYYHKPQFSLRDFWNVNEKIGWSNMLYMSVGRGGGTSGDGNLPVTEDGQVNYQTIYDVNAFGKFNIYTNKEQWSSAILKSSINNHMWYGYLSTLSYALTDSLKFSGGLDLRYYKGTHYRTVYDLLGGDVYFDNKDLNQNSNVKRTGDIIGSNSNHVWNYDGKVKWGGLFAQMEYKAGKISTFVNLSGAYSGYSRTDYFKRMDIVINDQAFSQVVGNEDIFFHNGTDYISAFSGATITTSGDTTYVDNSDDDDPDGYVVNATTYTNKSREARFAETGTKWIPGYTIKGGLNYNLTESMNVFFNLGYISKAPKFNNVIDETNNFVRDIENERIIAFEVGYSYKRSKFAGNINTYYTAWKNKPLSFPVSVMVDNELETANLNGIHALHAGLEIDFVYKVLKSLEIEGIISLGNWKWNSGDTIRVYDNGGQIIYQSYFNAKGVYVGDAAQTQYGASVRYEIKSDKLGKGSKLYVKSRLTYFARHYANFNPVNLDGSPANVDSDGNPRQSWLVPNYYTIDLHAGYSILLKKNRISVKFSLLNALDANFISDAQNNDFHVQNYDDYDAKSASVFFGLPRRYVVSLKITI